MAMRMAGSDYIECLMQEGGAAAATAIARECAALAAKPGDFSFWCGSRRRGGQGLAIPLPDLHLALRAHADAGNAPVDQVLPVDWHWRGRRIAMATGSAGSGPATGLMCNMTDIAAEHEAEFNCWYDTEHLPRLMDDAGAVAAVRYRAIHGSPRYLALYYVTDPGVVQTPQWRARAITPWAERIGVYRMNNQRWVMQRADAGRCEGISG